MPYTSSLVPPPAVLPANACPLGIVLVLPPPVPYVVTEVFPDERPLTDTEDDFEDARTEPEPELEPDLDDEDELLELELDELFPPEEP